MCEYSLRYLCWKVAQMKADLMKREAVNTGQKQDLI
jgi:hypothetical protein